MKCFCKAGDGNIRRWVQYISHLQHDLHGRWQKVFKVLKGLNKDEKDRLR